MNLQRDIERAEQAAEAARLVREDLRWNSEPGDTERERTIRAQLEKLRKAMAPIRSAIGKLIWDDACADREGDLRRVSAALQYNQKQLKKMKRRAR